MGQSTIFTAQRAQPPSNPDLDQIWRDRRRISTTPSPTSMANGALIITEVKGDLIIGDKNSLGI